MRTAVCLPQKHAGFAGERFVGVIRHRNQALSLLAGGHLIYLSFAIESTLTLGFLLRPHCSVVGRVGIRVVGVGDLILDCVDFSFRFVHFLLQGFVMISLTAPALIV
jgi:hypothetical protein